MHNTFKYIKSLIHFHHFALMKLILLNLTRRNMESHPNAALL